jgi:hypothetical protein
MMIVELVQLAAGILEARVVQRRGRVRVDVWSQREAEPPEQPLLIRHEVLIGQIERRRYGQVLRAHDRQAIARSGQLSRELGGMGHPGNLGGHETWEDARSWRHRRSIRMSCANAR